MKNKKAIIELAARIHVACLLFLYGTGKIVGGQFHLRGKLPENVAQQTLDKVGAYDLAWTFMGYSKAYIFFIGISQLVGAGCLLFNKTKLIGVSILLPILVNIVVFDIIFLDSADALFSASLYLLLLLLILYLNKDRVYAIFEIMTHPSKEFGVRKNVSRVFFALALFAIVFMGEQGMIAFIRYLEG